MKSVNKQLQGSAIEIVITHWIPQVLLEFCQNAPLVSGESTQPIFRGFVKPCSSVLPAKPLLAYRIFGTCSPVLNSKFFDETAKKNPKLPVMTEFLIPAFHHGGSICLTSAEMHLFSYESKFFFSVSVSQKWHYFRKSLSSTKCSTLKTPFVTQKYRPNLLSAGDPSIGRASVEQRLAKLSSVPPSSNL